MLATLERIEEIAANIRTFWFRAEKPVHYTAGEFTELHLPHTPADERGEKHWFTLSSSPTEPLLAITTKFATGRSSTFKQRLRSLKPGTQVTLAEPMGDFVLPKDPSIPLLFVASGIGITPVRSMVKYLLDTGEKRHIQLVYAVQQPGQLAFRELFETHSLNFTPIVRHPDLAWHGETGQLTADRILAQAAEQTNPYIYVSGPEHIVERLDAELKRSGIPNDRVITDFFHGYTS